MSRKDAQRWANMMPSQRSGRPLMGVYDLLTTDIDNAYFTNPYGAQDYFVDLNTNSTTGDGTSWDECVGTIAAGLLLADTSIGLSANRWWARRNRVFACGDGIAEALVLAAEKTDLIGVGYDVGSFPKVTGNFTIGTAVNGFRVFNMGFVPTTTAPVITFPAGMHGWELHGCHLYKVEGVTNSAQLLSTDCRDFVMNNTNIYPDAGAAKSTIGFNIAGTAQGVGRAQINNCLIVGIEAFNVVDTSAYFEGATCKNTTFIATALCIDENSDSIAFIDCRLITAAAAGDANGVNIVDWNGALAVGNEATSSDSMGPIPNLNALS